MIEEILNGSITPTPLQDVSLAAKIVGAIQWIGYLIAVGMLVYIGIKYIMASAQEKADLKGLLVKYVIGAVLIAGGVTLIGWIYDLFAK